MMDKAGQPSEERIYVFNGDFVDRGAWGLETLLMLACWKMLLPGHFFLVRGNHECTTCTHMYGFRGELLAKFKSNKDFKAVYASCKKLFSTLPLAALVAGRTLVLHGGLFAKKQPRATGNKRKKPAAPPLAPGNLEQLRSAGKGGMDPNGLGASKMATEVLWSDPAKAPGLFANESRGVGLIFGPDITKAFLEENGLRLIIRSHEGPDARWKRDDMHDMTYGYTFDHIIEGVGQLMTVFSAPDYPQFQCSQDERYNNLGAVAVLEAAGEYCQPRMLQYRAAVRPQAAAFYQYEDCPDSDEEMEVGLGSTSDAEASTLSEK
eukprot:jgi/Astpho2/772/gw1.00016.111.1_t